MECADCRERLPDFLLDELPESEAVLVQEHVALCTACQATYKELKGTGRALDAIPSMRPAQANREFSTRVLEAAKEESAKIIHSLPPERRLRLEARRATRQQRQATTPPTPPPARSRGGIVPLLLAVAVIAAAAFFLIPRSGAPQAGAVGTLVIQAGQVEQFYRKAGQNWTAATAGQPVHANDAFATGDDGRARFELAGGGAVLLGPASELRFLPSDEPIPVLCAELAKGEAGVERPAGDAAAPAWVLRCPALSVRLPPGARAYLTMPKDLAAAPCTVTVVQGQANVAAGRSATVTVKAGETATLKKDKLESASAPGGAASGLPAWRADLLDEAELGAWISGAVRITGRRSDGLLVELSYGFGRAEGLEDWRCEKSGKRLAAGSRGGVQVPSDARFTLAFPLAVPAGVEAAVNAETPKDNQWAFAVLEHAGGRVSVDLGKEAVLQVDVKPHPRAARLEYRNRPQAAERVSLEVRTEGLESQAVLATATGRTPPLPLPKGFEGPGDVWIQSPLGEGLVLDGLRVTGLLPREWLRKRLTTP